MKDEQEKAQANEEESGAVSTVQLMRKAPVSIVPILFHLIAVLLLFLAGVDIGWKQVIYLDIVTYHELAPTTNAWCVET